MLGNLSDLYFGLSTSLKVRCDSVIGFPMYYFLLVFNSYIWPNSVPLWDISSKTEWPWHWPFKVNDVKCNRINGLPLYAFLLTFISNIWPNSALLQDIRLRNVHDLDFVTFSYHYEKSSWKNCKCTKWCQNDLEHYKHWKVHIYLLHPASPKILFLYGRLFSRLMGFLASP